MVVMKHCFVCICVYY